MDADAKGTVLRMIPYGIYVRTPLSARPDAAFLEMKDLGYNVFSAVNAAIVEQTCEP